MSKFRDLIIDIQEDIMANQLTEEQLVEKYNVSKEFLNEVFMSIPVEDNDYIDQE